MWLDFALDLFAVFAFGAHEIVVELEAEPAIGGIFNRPKTAMWR